MKKLIAVSMFVFVVCAVPMVQAKNSALVKSTLSQADEKVKVKLEELPEAVKNALATEPFSAWSAESAMLNKTKDHYEIEVKKGAEKRVLKFSKDGKAVE
jgi:beta-mannanase